MAKYIPLLHMTSTGNVSYQPLTLLFCDVTIAAVCTDWRPYMSLDEVNNRPSATFTVESTSEGWGDKN